jgi:hypothetical protein
MGFKYLSIVKTPSPALLKLLTNNVIGTPKKSMVYQHMNVVQKVQNIKDPYFVNLERRGDILGTCCFCSRTTLNNSLAIHSFYIRYFTFKEQFRRREVKDKITNKSGEIKREIDSLLLGEGLGTKPDEKFYSYAYVDPKNERSLSLSKRYGFQVVRTFSTILFNRFYPVHSNRVTKISENEILQVKEKLKSYYSEFNMFSFENFNSESYFVINDDKGNIIAGVQANRDQWRIHEMPGLKGKLILNILSKLPVLKKVISKDYHFLSFEYIYCKEGHEDVLESLFESLLSKFRVYVAMTWIDRDTELFKSLKSLNLGLVNKINEEVNIQVIARFVNFKESEIKNFQNHPSYISAIDQT